MAAIQKADGYKLDKAHTFVVNSFEDHAKYMAVPDEEQPFVPPDFVPKESLHDWLSDKHARDQFVVRYNDETEIWFNDPTKPNPNPHYARHNWSDSYVSWCAFRPHAPSSPSLPRGTHTAHSVQRAGLRGAMATAGAASCGARTGRRRWRPAVCTFSIGDGVQQRGAHERAPPTVQRRCGQQPCTV
jgi:hypothetical protein